VGKLLCCFFFQLERSDLAILVTDWILIIPLPGLPSIVSATPRHNPHVLQIDRLKKILADLKTSNEETI
jgi:hypothetical protein